MLGAAAPGSSGWNTPESATRSGELGVGVGGTHAIEGGVEVVARVEPDAEVERALRLGAQAVEVAARGVADVVVVVVRDRASRASAPTPTARA